MVRDTFRRIPLLPRTSRFRSRRRQHRTKASSVKGGQGLKRAATTTLRVPHPPGSLIPKLGLFAWLGRAFLRVIFTTVLGLREHSMARGSFSGFSCIGTEHLGARCTTLQLPPPFFSFPLHPPHHFLFGLRDYIGDDIMHTWHDTRRFYCFFLFRAGANRIFTRQLGEGGRGFLFFLIHFIKMAGLDTFLWLFFFLWLF